MTDILDTQDDQDLVSDSQVDQRHEKRVRLMQALFAFEFSDQQADLDEEILKDVQAILAEAADIDLGLAEAAPERPLADINKVDLAILRLIVFESRHKKTPKKVLLNEAVELAKTYGTESSPKFVNAVLGKLLLPESVAPTQTEPAPIEGETT